MYSMYNIYNMYKMYNMYDIYSTYSMHEMHSMYNMYNTYMRLYVFICIRPSVCTQSHPYASITHPNIHIKYTFKHKHKYKYFDPQTYNCVMHRNIAPNQPSSKSVQHGYKPYFVLLSNTCFYAICLMFCCLA